MPKYFLLYPVHNCIGTFFRFSIKLSAFAVLMSVLFMQHSQTASACYRLVWCDYNTHLALGGVDPVGYFTHGKVVKGVVENEYQWRGAVWRFKNIGNMLAFIDNPEIFSPQYGGFDPLAVAEGKKTRARVDNWAIIKGKLYLFYSNERKEKVISSQERIFSMANDFWKNNVLRKS